MRLLALLLLAVLGASSLDAQRLGPPEKRPKLAAGADTNDAQAYLLHASRTIEESPGEAAQAFYWAARLDPSSADALYGRRVTQLMKKLGTLNLYMNGGRRARESKELRALDSLQLRALRLDPFLYRKYDRAMLFEYYRNQLRTQVVAASRTEMDQAIADYLHGASPATRAWLAYSQGRMPQALIEYEAAIKRAEYKPGLLIERARVYVMQGHLPPALADFNAALVELRARDEDKDDEVIFYNSKALVEHSIGVLQARLGKADSARAALGRAIGEDLSYFPAHIELGALAFEAKDTTTALSELGLAAELATDEPYVQFLYGLSLVGSGRHAEAVGPLKKAIELEPLYAAPQFPLAQSLERTADAAGARAAYERFLALSPRRDERRTYATQRLDVLKKSGAP